MEQGKLRASVTLHSVESGPIIIKLGVIDYVSDPYSYTNFG